MSAPRDEWRALSGRQRKRLTDVIYQRDAACCHLCGRPVRRADASVDHVIPSSKGGASTLDNLRLAHKRCNFAKGNRVPVAASSRVVVDGSAWFASPSFSGS
mgnify:CR=1 FL=1